MNKNIKITLGILGLLIVGVVVLISVGLYGMEIEDTYGDNQDIFYTANQGDIVVNHETKKFGRLEKTWTRFYVIHRSDTVDIDAWWDDNSIEIYRPVEIEISGEDFSYSDINRLKNEGKLKLKTKLR